MGTRALFSVRVAGRGWITRRSPHSKAAADPAAMVRQAPRSTVLPGFTSTTDTTGAGAPTAVRATEAESRSVLVSNVSNTFTMPVPVVPAAPRVYVRVTTRLSPGATFDKLPVGVTPQLVTPVQL